ncbi:VOC family protein [Haliangium sp.]|uniref:VOC family protein n=1 Tax=Haliangium sp. TaxID=2663208 RepID=UPI003D0D73FB
MDKPKNPTKLFPLIITNDLAAVRAYYVDVLGCELTHDLDGYLQVRFGKEAEAPELCFMPPGGMAAVGAAAKAFPGEGVLVSVPTGDADAHHRLLEQRGASIASPPADKPWGWRSFLVRDPNGLILDFFHVLAQADAADAAS